MDNIRSNRYRPTEVFPPGCTLEKTIEAIGHASGPACGRHVRALVKGKVEISQDTALKLDRVLGVDAVFWRNLEQQYHRHLADQKGKVP